jgi:hypothetical protein
VPIEEEEEEEVKFLIPRNTIIVIILLLFYILVKWNKYFLPQPSDCTGALKYTFHHFKKYILGNERSKFTNHLRYFKKNGIMRFVKLLKV